MDRSPFLIRIGHLALVRKGAVLSVGWQQVWWRIWWWAPKPKKAAAHPKPRPVLHWAPGDSCLPWCGASVREQWTIEYDFVTCPACRQKGAALKIGYEANTR